MEFRPLFFRLYDRTVGTGLCTFFETKISKSDFTRLCTDQDFVLSDDTLRTAAKAMKLTEEETAELLESARIKRESFEEK